MVRNLRRRLRKTEIEGRSAGAWVCGVARNLVQIRDRVPVRSFESNPGIDNDVDHVGKDIADQQQHAVDHQNA